ncbi:MAG: HPr family phosphocarrier protein [Micrococcales bacterium]|nr:HPr family phosphocarrier protein [Micrococcales bacterium]
MPSRRAIIASAVGLHARPAALFVEAAQATNLPVTIGRTDQPKVNAHSILAVMTLGVKQGEEVEIEAEGKDAEAVLNKLAAMLQSDLDQLPGEI